MKAGGSCWYVWGWVHMGSANGVPRTGDSEKHVAHSAIEKGWRRAALIISETSGAGGHGGESVKIAT